MQKQLINAQYIAQQRTHGHSFDPSHHLKHQLFHLQTQHSELNEKRQYTCSLPSSYPFLTCPITTCLAALITPNSAAEGVTKQLSQ